jgi:predicted FMN-binding regulatory protein PaiB
MRTSTTFQPSEEQIDALIQRHPFALVTTYADGRHHATPLPLLLDRIAGGRRLLGHFARSNPHADAVARVPEALIVFQGPHAYLSPSWYADRTMAPTWNYMIVACHVRIALLDGDAAAHAVERLTDAMEQGRPRAWRTPELGARQPTMLPRIVAFHAEVVEVEAKFKLGQNEPLGVLRDALVGLEAEGQAELVAAMRAANAGRLAPTEG